MDEILDFDTSLRDTIGSIFPEMGPNGHHDYRTTSRRCF